MNPQSMMTVPELAELLRLSQYTIRQKAKNGEFKVEKKSFAKKIGKAWRFNRTAALRFAGFAIVNDPI